MPTCIKTSARPDVARTYTCWRTMNGPGTRLCEADKCMAWRWITYRPDAPPGQRYFGQCGLVPQPPAEADNTVNRDVDLNAR